MKTTDERISITLPPPVRSAVGFAPSPCEQRPSFGLRAYDVYAKQHGLWPLVWHTRVETNADLYALASPVAFEARIEASAETPAATAATQEFRRRSDFTVADCEQNRTVQIEVAAPEGASDIVCKAAWTDAAGETSTSGQCERGAGVLRATGVLKGLAKVCSPDKLCSCSTHSQGVLEISGHFRIAQAASGLTPVTGLAPLDFPAGGLASSAIAVGRLRLVKLDVGRRDCSARGETTGDSAGGWRQRLGGFEIRRVPRNLSQRTAQRRIGGGVRALSLDSPGSPFPSRHFHAAKPPNIGPSACSGET